MDPESKDIESKQTMYSRLFGGIFSTLEECPGKTSSPMYSRSVKMLDEYLEQGLNNQILENEVVNWINSPVLDTLASVEFEEQTFPFICKRGHLEMARWFLEKHPTLDVHQDHEEPFRNICSSGNLDMVKWFLEKYPETYLHWEQDYVFKVKHFEVSK